jgi:hypothetical protein
MSRWIAVACGALAVGALPAAAHELRLKPPELSAQTVRCTPHQRDVCEGIRQHAVERDLSCDACAAPPMPADVMAPSGPSSPAAPAAPACLPRASGPLPLSCTGGPRLDSIPRP